MAVQQQTPGKLEAEMEGAVKRWIASITDAADSLRNYVRDIVRESKFMVDEYNSVQGAASLELIPSVREPVVYEFIVASATVAATLTIGPRRSIPIPANTIVAFACKMRVYENEQRILAANAGNGNLYLEMTGHIYPHITA